MNYSCLALLGCWGLCVAGCRNDPSASDGKARTTMAAATTSVTPTTPSAPAKAANDPTMGAPAGPAMLASSAAPSAPIAVAASAATDGDGRECPGPAPLGSSAPHFEQGKLASHKQGFYRFELTYPVFTEESGKAAPKMNEHVLEQLTAVQKRFVKEAESTKGKAPDPDNARWYEGKCDVAFAAPSFASVLCETMEGPGAHPNVDHFGINLQTCPDVKRVELSDLCRALPECRQRLIDLINEDFRTGAKKETGIQFRDAVSNRSGDATKQELQPAKLRSFTITPVGLRVFLFDELPHVLQAFAIVDIPSAKVRPVLRDDVTRRIWGHAGDGASRAR